MSTDERLVETVPSSLVGQRLDRVLAMLTGQSRAQVERILADGRVLVDGREVAGKVKVTEGQVIEIELPDPSASQALAADDSVVLELLHVDDDVIVINKQPGLVVHPATGHAMGTLVQGVLALYPEIAAIGASARPGIVHRLDAGTSGVLVVARSQRAFESRTEQLADRTMSRVYDVLVIGWPEHSAGTIDAPIGRSGRDPLRNAVTPDGKPARTHYTVESSFSLPELVALLECRLESGRTHQIRVHLEAIGHPVVGDEVYAGRRRRHVLKAPRPMLHARELTFVHPATGERQVFTAPRPADYNAVLAQLALAPARRLEVGDHGGDV